MIVLIEGKEYIPEVHTDANGVTWAILYNKHMEPIFKASSQEWVVRDYVQIPGALVLHDHTDADGELADKLLGLALIEDTGLTITVKDKIVQKRLYRQWPHPPSRYSVDLCC